MVKQVDERDSSFNLKSEHIQKLISRAIFFKRASFFLDLLSIVVAFWISALFRLGFDEGMDYMHYQLTELAGISTIVFVVFYLTDIYPSYRSFLSFIKAVNLLRILAYAFVFEAFYIYLIGKINGIFVLAIFLQGFFIPLFKILISLLARIFLQKSKAVVVGYSPLAEAYLRSLKEDYQESMPYHIIGVVCQEQAVSPGQDLPFPRLGDYHDLEKILENYKVANVILSTPHPEDESLQDFLIIAYHHHTNLLALQDVYAGISKKIPYKHVNKGDFLVDCLMTERYGWLKKKRVFDILLSGVLLFVFFPIGCLVALGVKISSRGPIFYFQDRVGFRGREFKMVKFRTMRTDAEKAGIALTAQNDPRVTKFGRFLRKTHLDEIPQLINVLRGEMGFVGPRPERREFIEKLERKIPHYSMRLFTRPGITGWAQVSHGYASTMHDLEEKFSYDLYYLKNMCLSLDTQIILQTTKHLFFATGQ